MLHLLRVLLRHRRSQRPARLIFWNGRNGSRGTSTGREDELIDGEAAVARATFHDETEVGVGVDLHLTGHPLGSGRVQLPGRHIPNGALAVVIVILVFFILVKVDVVLVFGGAVKSLAVDFETGSVSGSEGREPDEENCKRTTYVLKR